MSTPTPTAPQIICSHWKADIKNGRQGFADLTLPVAGITIKGVVLNCAPTGKRWISWPAVATGRGYSSCFSFMDGIDREAWQAAAVRAIDTFVAGIDASEEGGELPLLMP